MLDNYEQLWRAILLRCPLAGPLLARQWLSFSFRKVVERRRWSWLLKANQFLPPAVVNAGTVAVTRGSTAVVGTGTAFTSAMVGRQFRVGVNEPIYTVATFTDATNIALDQAWGGKTVSAVGYEIFQAYYTPPSDFHAFVSVIDPQRNWQLYINVGQDELDAVDPQRARAGDVYVVSWRDYDTTVTPPLPRYELWAHPKSERVYPYLYESRPPDLEDSGASLPRFIRGDVLLDMALAEAARWPGPSAEQKNPYFNLALSGMHEAKARDAIAELERQDDETYLQDVRWQVPWQTTPWALVPWGDASFLQKHSY